MDLPLMPPVKPMLAKPVKEIPSHGVFEPKWDGFRAIIFRDGDEVEIGSRNGRPMTRYFPELVTQIREQMPERVVVDGEIVVADEERGRLDFEALQQRIHPADSRVRMLAEQVPARFVAFDILALGDEDLTQLPFDQRRSALTSALQDVVAPLHVTRVTRDPARAHEWFTAFEGAGLDGLIVKSESGLYEQNKRTMSKVKHQRTADCVLAGYRLHKSGPDALGSLLLGLYREDGVLAHVGVAASFTMARRRELLGELSEWETTFEGHPWDWGGGAQTGDRTPRSSETSRWSAGKDLSFVPLRPELVVEVAYDAMEGDRFRHTTQFVRWRPDREPASCTYDQLEVPVRYDLADVLTADVRQATEPAEGTV